MANSIKVVVNTGKQETTQTVDVLQGNGDAGQPTRIKAVKGARYQLEDPALKNTGPQHLRTKRIGKSLHITLDGSTESDLIIDDYYDEAFQGDGGGGIYGRAEDGSIYEYIPQDASQEGKLMELADGGSPVDQVLGADPVEDFELSALPLAAAAGGGLGIGGVAAGVAGAGALAGGGGGGAGTTATTAEADAALAAVKNFAENNGSGLTAATGTAPTEATYSTAGVTGVTTQNVGAINSALASAAVNGAKVDTVAKLQALVDAYRAILDEANGTAEDATPNADPSAAQYEAVGVTGVDAGAEETLLGDVIGSKVAADVDTVEELQALADAVGATVGYTGTQTGPSVSQLNALTGASSVTPDNLAAVQAAIAKANASGAPITSQAALKALIDTATQNYQAALDAIKAAAENNTATQANPSVAQYEALGVHGVSASNLAAINTALDSAAVNAAAADTAAKVQALVDSYNTILAAADGVDKNTGSVPTQANYASVGVTGVDTKVKADLLSDVVDGKAKADVDTVQELQDLANAVGATVGYTGTQTGPTDGQLNALTGENTVTPDNLAAVKAAIAQANGGSTPITTQEQLKAIIAAAVQSYQAALDAIKAAAENNTATLTSPSAEQYAAAGVVGVTPSNLGAVNSALNSAAVNGTAADTAGEVQGIVSAYKAILAAADGADNNATNPTQENYTSVGVTGIDTKVKADLLSDVVDGKAKTDVDTVQELQDLATAVGATVGYRGNQTAPSASQINSLIGGSAVTSSNLAAVQAAIAEANKGSTPIASQEQLQALVVATLGSEAQKAAQAALDAAAAANAAKDQLAQAVGTLSNPATPGQLGAVETAQAAANAAADAAKAASDAAKAAADAAQSAAVATNQAVPAGVDAANTAAGRATTAAAGAETAAAGSETKTDGIVAALGSEAEKAAQAAIDAAAGAKTAKEKLAEAVAAAANSATPEQLAAVAAAQTDAATAAQKAADAAAAATAAADAAHAAAVAANETDPAGVAAANTAAGNASTEAIATAQEIIRSAAQVNNASATMPSLDVYSIAGVHDVTNANLASVNDALDSAVVNGAAADTTAKVQAIVDGYNAILAAADGVDKNMSSVPTQTHYASVGVTGVDTKVKADLLSDVVDGKAKADVDTVQELQDLANAVGATVGYIGGQTGPTDSQLNALTGESTVTPANLAAVKAAIAQANGGSTPITTQDQLKAVIAAAVQSYQTAALNAIKDAAENNTATLTSPSAEQYTAAGVVGVTPSNLGAVNSALNSAVVNGAAADTAGEVQGIVNAYKAILAEANGSAADATPNVDPSAAQYAAVGVTGVDVGAEEQLLGDVIGSKVTTDVDTVQELQDLANAVGATVGYIGGQTGPTDGQLNALTGENTVTPDNLAAVKAAIAQANGGSTPITTQEQLKAIIAAAVESYQAALDAIKAAAENNTATLTSPSAEQYAAAGVVGVTPSNLGAMNSALNSAVVNGAAADTAGEVQGIVSAYKAILAAADGVDNNAANPTQTQYALIGVDGVNTAQKESLLGDVIDIQATDAVDTVDEVQALANAVAAVMSGAAGGTAPTLGQLQALGLQNVNSNNIALVQAAIAATNNSGSDVDTLAKLQALITSINDPAVIGGVSTASLTETNAVQTATGTLTITDADSAATFAAQTATVGTNGYGKFDLSSAGVWTYIMDSAHNEFVAGTNYTDSFSVDNPIRSTSATALGASYHTSYHFG